MDGLTNSFGYWLRRRRKALDLTQEALAKLVACSRFTIRKIEADERRPSRRLAERLANKLTIAVHERDAFLDSARAVRPDRLLLDTAPITPRDQADDRDSGRFVGRDKEYGLLVALLAKLALPADRVVLVEGEPGIGKSRLLHEFARHARQRGVAVLAANCYEIERATPYQPVIDLVTQALELASPVALRKLSQVPLAEIAAIVPLLAERIAVPVLSPSFPEARQARLFRAITQLFEAVAGGRQLVVIVDDVQWADDASAQFLHYFARQAASAPLVVLFAYRDEELADNARLAELVNGLRREPHVRHMPLAGLSLAATTELVEGTGDAKLAERLQRETGGNPFFLTSILHALRVGEIAEAAAGALPLPEALRASVRARLAHVPADARATLEVAAVLGRKFDFDLLLAVTADPEEKLLRSLETLVRRGLLREESDGYYDFSHDKVREVVYLELGAARRMLLHRSLAETLEQRGEGEPHERDARLAEHYERGRVWSKAVHHMLLAADRSQKLFAMRDALLWFDRAIELTAAHREAITGCNLVDLHEQRGRARAQAGQTAGAIADIRVVIAAARARGDRARAREALIQLGMTYRRADDYERAVACLNQALDECRAINAEREAADTLYHLGTVMWSDCRNREAIAYHEEAVAICERLGLTDIVAVQAYHGRGEAHLANLEPIAALECFNRSIDLARGFGDKSYECENLMMVGYALTGFQGIGNYPRALENFEAALDIARRTDLEWHIGPTVLGLDHVRACLGQYGTAFTGMTEMLRSLESLKQTRYQIMAYAFLGMLLLDLGLAERAAECSARALELIREAHVTFWRPHLEANLAIARIRLGDLDVGATLEGALCYARENSERRQMVRCLEGLAELALMRGDPQRCLSFAAELATLAAQGGLEEIAALARRWSGEALVAAGRCDEALVQLELAASAAETIGRVRLALDANAALARISGDAVRRARAVELAILVRHSVVGSPLETDVRDVFAR